MRASTIILGLWILTSSTSKLLAASPRFSSHVPDRAPTSNISRSAVDPSLRLSALWDGRQSVDFRAADNPPMFPATAARFLRDDEYVLGLTINGESRAYPTRFLAWHHIVNDSVGKPDHGGKAFVTVTY